MRSLVALSAMIFAASVAAHVSTFTTFDALSRFPYLWMIHLLIFVVFIPAVVMQPRQVAVSGKRGRSFSELFAGAPRVLVVLAPMLFLYMIMNFAVFMIRYEGQPQRTSRGYEMREHGKFVRSLDETQFHATEARQLRGFSGHWMFFSGVAMTMHVATLARRRRSAEVLALSPVAPAAIQGGISITLHAGLRIVVTAFGFFGGFLIVMLPATLLVSRAACIAFPIGVICAFAGIGIGQWIIDRNPARCPRCGGRAFFREDRSGGGKGSWEYACVDCHALFDTAGAIVADPIFRIGATMPPPVEPKTTDR